MKLKVGGKKKSTQDANEEPQTQTQTLAASFLENHFTKGETEERKGKENQTLIPESQSQGPKLDDGFFEIETIRRKRVRKGQLQYLIKWRGWPETANTWEPLQNLQSVPDLIDAFEESLKSRKPGRHSKRKHVVLHHTQPNKSHQRSTTSYSLRNFPTATPATDSHPLPSPPINHLSLTHHPSHPQTLIFANQGQPNEHAFVYASHQMITQRNGDKNDYDPKLSELKATTNNGVDAEDKLALHFQQTEASTGNDQLKVDSSEPVQSGSCRGAKRRKSGSVKRFKRETYACEPVDSDTPQKAINMSDGGMVEQGWTGVPGCYVGNNSHKKMDDAKTACNIVKIIKPIGYSASLSSNMQDVVVTFMALRSDGTEVEVDNRYLKSCNPLLLINFYEQHLRYNPTL